MKQMQDRLADDEELAQAYRGAHEAYLAAREEIGHVPEIAGISAGGMPTREVPARAGRAVPGPGPRREPAG